MSGEWLGTDVPLYAQRQRPRGMGLHICAVVRSGSLSEHVEVVNDGAEPVTVTGLELTDCCGQHHEHVYAFPQGDLAAGQTAYVYSGTGTNQLTRSGDLILYAGLQARVWKDDSHVAYLRHPDGH
ncbi:MAG TPA: lamin tail domain-containing protein [Solirubrobacteraceae bacterium]|nr:lamin tail domain-containing protein [Solirubrobacteraceae bacterium]